VQRQRIDQFLTRLSQSAAGQLIVHELLGRTTTRSPIFGRRGSSPLQINFSNLGMSDLFRGRYMQGTQVIELGTSAFQSIGTYTMNVNGSENTFEQVLLHEIIHFLLSDNFPLPVGYDQSTTGALSYAMSVARNSLHRGSISRDDYNYIT